MEIRKEEKNIVTERKKYSEQRLSQLKDEFTECKEIKEFQNLAVFAAGSYARYEASEFSDIDLFFLITTNPQQASIDVEELALFEQKILLMHQPCIQVENDY
jgi:UTP:GlnB (protein PII) uridylyltransferase